MYTQTRQEASRYMAEVGAGMRRLDEAAREARRTEFTIRRTIASARVPGVTRLVEMMTERDGLAYVGPRYYGSYDDAALQRTRYAQRLRRDALRAVPRAVCEVRALLDYTQRPEACPWCGGVVRGEGVTLGGRRLHEGCADQAMGVSAEPTEVAA